MHPDTIDPRAYARRWKTLGVLSLSLLIIGLDNTVLNVALPTLQTHFSASASTLQWIVDAYLLAFAGVLLTMGTLGDRFGRKRALQSGLVLFGVASVLAALAQNADQLIVLRAAMGIGGAMIMPATLSVIMDVFPREERGKAIGIWSAIAGVGIGLGPFVGGLLLEWFSWSSVFWLNVPIVGIALVAGFSLVPESRDPRPGRVRPARRRAVDRDARHARLRDHRGDAARLDRSARARLLRRRRDARRRLRRLGAPGRRADAPARLLRQPELHRRVGRRRARLLRDDGLGLRLHAVPAVRSRLQRAGGRRRDAPARARPRRRLGRLEPPRRARRPSTGHRGRPVRRRGRAEHQPRLDARHGTRAARPRHVRARAVDGRRDGAGHRLRHERGARGQGRRRLGDERRHPPGRRRARRRRDRLDHRQRVLARHGRARRARERVRRRRARGRRSRSAARPAASSPTPPAARSPRRSASASPPPPPSRSPARCSSCCACRAAASARTPDRVRRFAPSRSPPDPARLDAHPQ